MCGYQDKSERAPPARESPDFALELPVRNIHPAGAQTFRETFGHMLDDQQASGKLRGICEETNWSAFGPPWKHR